MDIACTMGGMTMTKRQANSPQDIKEAKRRAREVADAVNEAIEGIHHARASMEAGNLRLTVSALMFAVELLSRAAGILAAPLDISTEEVGHGEI